MALDSALIVQSLLIPIYFLLALIFTYLPIRYFTTVSLAPQKDSRDCSRQSRLLAYANSLVDGIFLGTCFIQFIPHVEHQLTLSFVTAGLPLTGCSKLTQFIVLSGFFLVALLDSLFQLCHRSKASHQVKQQHGEWCELEQVNSAEAEHNQQQSTATSYLVAVVNSSNSSESTDSEHDDVLFESKQLLDSKRATQPSGKQRRKRYVKRMSSTNRSQRSRKLKSKPDVEKEEFLMSPEQCSEGLHISTKSSLCEKDIFGAGPASADHVDMHSIVLVLVLCVHSVFEGLAIGLQTDLSQLLFISIGIAVHTCLMSFSLGVSISSRAGTSSSSDNNDSPDIENDRQQNQQRKAYLFCCRRCCFCGVNCKLALLYSCSLPAGVLLGLCITLLQLAAASNTSGLHAAGQGFASLLISAVLQALAAGTFLYIVFVDMLPELLSSSNVRSKGREFLLYLLVCFSGFILIAALSFVV